GINAVQVEVIRLDSEFLADESLQGPNGDRFVQCSPAAFGLAGSRANPPADGSKRVRCARNNIGVFVAAFPNRLDITSRVGADRASFPAKDLPRKVIRVRQ